MSCDENPLASLFGAQDERKRFCCSAEAVKNARFGKRPLQRRLALRRGYADSALRYTIPRGVFVQE
jgi:hypothetical protein